MTRHRITAVSHTPEGARLTLNTGEVLTLPNTADVALSFARPFVLVLTQDSAPRVLDVPGALLVTLAQELGIHAPELTTAAGQAELMAQGIPGPFPVPT